MTSNGRMHFASYYRWLLVRDWLSVAPFHRVLDVGTDDGEIISRISAPFRVAVDLHPRCPDPSVGLIQGNALGLPFPDCSFDTVLAFDVVEHIQDDRAALAELVRVLTAEGILWITTPCADFSLFPSFVTARANRGWGHVRNGYTVEEIRRKLPANVTVEATLWNESALRFLHLGLHALNRYGELARILARGCFEIDKLFPRGQKGHLLIRVRRGTTALPA